MANATLPTTETQARRVAIAALLDQIGTDAATAATRLGQAGPTYRHGRGTWSDLLAGLADDVRAAERVFYRSREANVTAGNVRYMESVRDAVRALLSILPA